MAELNLKQIIDRLNAEFTGETRKLVFWYDDKAEFAEDMETVELQNAKIYHLQPDNQFYTKYFLERVDKTTNYLIYAPFPKPDVRDNHLEDTMLYSRRFFADRASLLSVDLGIEEKYKPVIEKHIKFFANKERTQRFYDLEIENFNEENILVGLLSAVSYGRGTAIDTSDIDILMSLPESYYNQFNSVYGNGQSRLLQVVRQAILVRYPRSEVRADGQVVKINFSDGMFFEILPAFKNWDGSYRYPDTNMGGNWRSTNPKAEQDAMKNKNIRTIRQKCFWIILNS